MPPNVRQRNHCMTLPVIKVDTPEANDMVQQIANKRRRIGLATLPTSSQKSIVKIIT